MREQIEKSYAHTFGEQPPAAHNVLDSRLVEEGTVRAHTAALEQKVAVLQQELAQHAANETDEDDVPWVTGGSINIELHVPEERAASIRTGIVEGRKCLLVPIEDDEDEATALERGLLQKSAAVRSGEHGENGNGG